MFTSCSLMMTNWALWPLMFWCLWKFDADGRHGRKFFSTNKKLSMGTCIMEFYVLSLINHPIKCCCTIFWSYLENPVRNMAAYRKSNKKKTLAERKQFKKDINLHQQLKSLTRIIPVVLLRLFYKGPLRMNLLMLSLHSRQVSAM